MSENIINQKKKKKTLIINVLLYVISAILLIITVFGVIARLSSTNGLFIFGNRFDVVLTNSMSAKNPEYEEFLRGHDNQIQKFDLVVSKQIASEEELSVYDIVLFRNPGIGVDMHRIVAKEQYSCSQLYAFKASYKTLNNYEGVCLNEYASSIASNVISHDEITLVTYSTEDDQKEHFYFSIPSENIKVHKTKEIVEDGFITTYSIKRETTTPVSLIINHGSNYNFENEIITSCVVTVKNEIEPISFDKESIEIEGTTITATSNRHYKYTIRGDLSNTADGEFTRESIISKVTTAVPKLGYVVRYLSSIWGIILFASLGVIIIVYDIVSSKIRKKEALLQAEKQEENKND